jgi:hypothetical protein
MCAVSFFYPFFFRSMFYKILSGEKSFQVNVPVVLRRVMVVSLKQRVDLGKSFLVILNSMLLLNAVSDPSIISFGALHVRELIVIMILHALSA